MTALYNTAFLIWLLLSAPVAVWKKKYRDNFLAKLGFKLHSIPNPVEAKVVWIHAVSLGEMKASLPFIIELKREVKDLEIYFSTSTVTAYNQAKKVLKENVDTIFYLPFDFSFLIRQYVKKIRPDLLVFVETDLWPHLMQLVKEQKGVVALINGKISERSYKRFSRFPKLANWILDSLDIVCCQSEEYKKRFLACGVDEQKIEVTGNLKYDAFSAPKLLLQARKEKRRFITLASTHENEEKLLLEALASLEEVTFFLAPRHPERFGKVEKILKEQGISYDKFTKLSCGLSKATKRVVLIDVMGELDKCYALSDVVIVAGSFISKVGGHNIYEPIRFYKTVLFGPFMHNQKELVNDVLAHKAAVQTSINQIHEDVKRALVQPIEKHLLEQFETAVKGASTRSLKIIQKKTEIFQKVACHKTTSMLT